MLCLGFAEKSFCMNKRNFALAAIMLSYFFLVSCGQGEEIGDENYGQNNFFPLAVWMQDPGDAVKYKDLGINMYVALWNELDQRQMDLLRASDMKVICRQNSYGLEHKYDTLIYAWMHNDEPDNARWNKEEERYDPCIESSVIIQDYNKMKENDPSRPVFLNLGMGVSYIKWNGRGACKGNTESYKISHNGYLKACDIASFDIYPVNSYYPEVQNNLWYVPKGIDSLYAWSGSTKDIWCCIETTKINDKGSKPSVSEIESEVWMALIHRAKGIIYFCHSFVTGENNEAAMLHDPVNSKGIKEINARVSSLAPVINSVNGVANVSVLSDNPDVPIHYMTKSYNGQSYIFAVSMRDGNSNATFYLPSGKKAEVIGEDRTIPINNNQFNDSFEPYAVHIYKISSVRLKI